MASRTRSLRSKDMTECRTKEDPVTLRIARRLMLDWIMPHPESGSRWGDISAHTGSGDGTSHERRPRGKHPRLSGGSPTTSPRRKLDGPWTEELQRPPPDKLQGAARIVWIPGSSDRRRCDRSARLLPALTRGSFPNAGAASAFVRGQKRSSRGRPSKLTRKVERSPRAGLMRVPPRRRRPFKREACGSRSPW